VSPMAILIYQYVSAINSVDFAVTYTDYATSWIS
jgi:hypothetical protein